MSLTRRDLCVRLLLLAVSPGMAYAAGPISLPLHYRSAQDLLPVLREQFPRLNLSAWQGQLLASGDPAELDRLQQTLPLLDTPARQLRIQLRQRLMGQGEQQQFELQGQISIGKHGQLILGTGSSHIGQQEGHGTRELTQTLIGQADSPLTFTLSQQRQVIQNGSSSWQEAQSGFTLQVSTLGGIYRVQLKPQLAAFHGNTVQQQQLQTTVDVPQSGWFAIGDVLEQLDQRQRQLLGQNNTAYTQQYQVWIQIDTLP